jgi:CubicO group peptidase (beta-lactamase class C family)
MRRSPCRCALAPASALIALITLAAPVARAQHIVGARDSQSVRTDSVFRRFDRTDSPGCVVGVYENGALRYGRGYGMASLEHGVPLTTRTVLDVGSISKQFTAMAILMLVKEGKLSLDDPLRKHFPEMPAYADGVTWRRALSQTSGLRDLWTLWGQTGRTFAGDTIDALRVITRSAEPNYVPGERYLYTNSGWILAAQLVYRLTGTTLAQFAEERMFAPLGMRDTRFFSDNAAVIPHVATAYSPRGDGFRVSRNTYDGAIMGAGGVHTTIEDFGRWLHNYDQGTVGGHDVISTMTTATRLNDGSPAKSGTTQAYAVGLNVGTLRGVPVVSHGGSWAGFRAHFLRFPEQRVAVATFCNHSAAGPDSLARHVAAIYIGGAMQADSAALWRASLAAAPEITTDSATRRALTGVWRNVARGEVRRTRLSGDTLLLITGSRTRLSPIGTGRFRAGADAELRFEGGAAPNRMFVRTSGDTMSFMRADTVAHTPATLAAYAGEYRNDEIETTQRWVVEKDQLVLFANERRLGTLEPTYADGFLRGESVIDVQRDARGRITGYTVQAGRVRQLRFTRVR